MDTIPRGRVPPVERFEPAGPGDLPPSVAEARGRFLRLVAELAPCCIDHLAGGPLHSARAFARRRNPAGSPWRWRDVEALAAVWPEAARLRDAVRDWAREYRIDADWVAAAAVRTLSLWVAFPDMAAERRWFPAVVERRVIFREDEQGMTAGCAAELAKERWARRAPVRRRPTPRRPAGNHLAWLVWSLVERKNLPEIARRYSKELGREMGEEVDPTTIRDGLARASALVGLPLPDASPGRPRGAKDSRPRHLGEKVRV